MPRRRMLLVTGAIVLLGLGLVAGLREFDGLSGGTLIVQRVDEPFEGLALDETRTREEMPELAALSDAAWAAGRATSEDDDLRGAALDYLHREAARAGRDFHGEPVSNLVVWKGAKLHVVNQVS